MKLRWINGFALAWSTYCECGNCYWYTLFHRSNGRTKLLKRFFIDRHDYRKLAEELLKYFKYEYKKL